MLMLVIMVAAGALCAAILLVVKFGRDDSARTPLEEARKKLGGRSPLELPRSGEFDFDIVGESHYTNYAP